MQIQRDDKRSGAGSEPSKFFSRWKTPALLLVAALIAWFAPAHKENAALGRLSYAQFWMALALTGLALSSLVVALAPATQRRLTGFKIAAIAISFVMAVAIIEAIAFLLPVRHQMDNPWYATSGGGAIVEDGLPYGRPPHLKWQGLSTGDLAMMNGDEDPYAQVITFETDRDGFHNNEDLPQADVVVIGDSFTEAGNLPSTNNLAVLLGRRLGVKSRNLGRAGYTAPTELIVLKKYGMSCRPKLVVWQIAESNDLSESVDYEKWIADGRPPYIGVWKKPRQSRADAWPERSPTHVLFNLFRNHDPHPWPYGGVFKDRNGDEHPIRFVWESALDQPALGHPGWNTFSRALLEGAELCRTNGVRLIVVMIPMKYRILGPNTAQPPDGIAKTTSAPGFRESTALGPVLQAFCATNGVEFIDATAELQKRAAAGELVCLPFDTHLSSLGHQALADLVMARVGNFSATNAGR